MSVPFKEVAVTVEEFLQVSPELGMLGVGAVTAMRTREDVAHIATVDEPNAFTYVKAPHSWWRYQAAPRVRARELPRGSGPVPLVCRGRPSWVCHRVQPRRAMEIPRRVRLDLRIGGVSVARSTRERTRAAPL